MTPDLVLPAQVDNSTWHQFTTWFTTKSSWLGGTNGTAGVLHLFVQHLWISALSLAITCAIGIPLAALLSRWRRGGLIVTTVANGARSVPIIGVMLLLAIGPIGIGTEPAVIALVIFALPPILTNTYTGICEVDAETTRAAIGMGMTRLQVMRSVELPLAIPLVATGIRLAAVQIWATATIAAIVGSGGLGQLITVGYATQYYGEVYGGVLVIALSAIALDTVLKRAQTAVRLRFGASQSSLS
ncbi:MAG TPA: ABC transporter permease [Mycobacteriales bacterium]|nr:ABC transporter permease [Mycobacteriales bacterium]